MGCNCYTGKRPTYLVAVGQHVGRSEMEISPVHVGKSELNMLCQSYSWNVIYLYIIHCLSGE